MITLTAYVNCFGVFLVLKNEKTGKYILRKYTFGKSNYAEVRITAAIFEKLEYCSSFHDSWEMAHAVLKEKLQEINDKKKEKYQGNC